MSYFLLGLTVYFSSLTSAHSFTIGLPESTQGTHYQTQLEGIFSELYTDIASEVKFAYLPFTRMLVMVKKQQVDAVVYQMSSAADNTEILLQVEEPLTQIGLFAACTQDTSCNPNQRSRFVVVADSLYAKQWCHTHSVSCLSVTNPDLARKAVKDGLADIHIMQRTQHITEPCLSEQGLKVRPILDTEIEVFHYVAKQHHHLLLPLSNKIRQMKAVFQRQPIVCKDLALNVRFIY